MSGSGHTRAHMVCLGCGCACDDIELQMSGDRIVDAVHACERGAAWFGDGRVPARVLVDAVAADVATGITVAADRLARAARPLVYLAPEVTCEAQRATVALADHLRATLDTVTSAHALGSILAAQERGRAGATLGEIRNRADVLLFWGVDPAIRYPRFMERYAPAPERLSIDRRLSGRVCVAADIGNARGPAQADRRFEVNPAEELDVLAALTAMVQRETDAGSVKTAAGLAPAADGLCPLLTQAQYAAIIVDGEPREAAAADPQFSEGIIALTQALNGITRAAAVVLREGGNRSGADAVLTWQTGFPAAVEFTNGYPRYRPHDGTASACLDSRHPDAVVIVGAATALPDRIAARAQDLAPIVIGPRATESRLAHRGVAIDTGMPGIHEGGTALRMDDVPLPLGVVLAGPPATESIVRALTRRIVTNRGLW